MAVQPNGDSTLNWRKSSISGESGGCVEVAQQEAFVLVRDSRNQSGAVLAFPRSQWLDLVLAVKSEY